METKLKLKSKYKKFVRLGKKKEAEKCLKEIWKISNKEKKVVVGKTKVNRFKKKTKKVNELDSLISVKGIGQETLNDLKRIFKSLRDLEKALLDNKVPLRNDIVKKLKKFLNK